MPYGDGFSWESVHLGATGNGIESNGWSLVDNDYTENICTSPGWYDSSFLGSASYGETAEYEGANSESLSPLTDYDDGDVSDYYMEALSYIPGGKAVPVQYVVQFTCDAYGAPSADWMGTTLNYVRDDQTWTAIPYPDITMAGGRLGADGYYYKAVSSGLPSLDITPNFDSGPSITGPSAPVIVPTLVNSYWQFTVAANTYKAVIQMVTNGCFPWTLDPSIPTEICVGQHVQFQMAFPALTAWAPPLLPTPQSYTNWTLPTKYVNTNWQLHYTQYLEHGMSMEVYYGSTNYYADPSLLLRQFTAQCWYVNGPGGSALAGGRLYFPNGQETSFAALGKLQIYRPPITLVLNRPFQPFVITNTDGVPSIQLGDNNGGSEMNFDTYLANMSSILKYKGNADVNQLIIRQSSYCTTRFYLLDKDFLYFGGLTIMPSTCKLRGVPFTDGPSIPVGGYYSYINDHFKDSLMFKPEGDANIYVTLGTTTWNWWASAYNLNGMWTLGGWEVYPPSQWDSSDAFPYYPYPWTFQEYAK